MIAERASTILPAPPLGRELGGVPLAELLNPLVVAADGTLVPVQYHMGSRFQLGNLHDMDWVAALADWKRERYPTLHEIGSRALQEACSSEQVTVDIYRLLTDAANTATVRSERWDRVDPIALR